MPDLEPPPRSPRDQVADDLAASACEVLGQLLPADVASELRAVVADQLALHPALAVIVDRAVDRPPRAESGDEVQGTSNARDEDAAAAGVTLPFSTLDARRLRR